MDEYGTPSLADCLSIEGDVQEILDLCLSAAVDFLSNELPVPEELLADLHTIAASHFPEASRASSIILALARRDAACGQKTTTHERGN